MLVYRGVGSKFSPVAVGLVLKWGFEGRYHIFLEMSSRGNNLYGSPAKPSQFFFPAWRFDFPNGKNEEFLGTLGTPYSLRLSPHVLPGLNVSSVSSLDGTCQYFVMHLWLCLEFGGCILLFVGKIGDGFRRTLERVNMQQLFPSGYCFARGCRQSLWRRNFIFQPLGRCNKIINPLIGLG